MPWQVWSVASVAWAFWCLWALCTGEFIFGQQGIGAKNPWIVSRHNSPVGFWIGIGIAAAVSMASGVEAVLRFLAQHQFKL